MSILTLADEFFEYLEETDHLTALWNGDTKHLDSWDDITPEGRSERRRRLVEFADRAASATPSTDLERALTETIEFTGRSTAIRADWYEALYWPNPAVGFVPLLLTFLPRYPLVTAEQGERYLTKVSRLPRVLEDWRLHLIESAGHGLVPIRHLVSTTIDQISQQLSAGLSQGPLGTQQPPAEITDGETWKARLVGLLDGPVSAAFEDLHRTLVETVLPAAPSDDRPGLVHLDGGAERYERLVWVHTSLDVSAAEVHQIGLDQIARLEKEYRSLAGPLLGTDDVAEIYRRLRSDPDLHYQTSDDVVRDATTALGKAAAAMGDWFGTLPQASCVATSTPQGPLAFYSPPAADGSKPGTFFFNTSDPSSWGTFALEAVTYHEGIPGHHLQLAIARESTLPRLLAERYIAAYNEGWGLYTERLADEMGLYSSNLDRVGMLSADSMRACRLVVDTGIHALGWSRDRAIEFMVENSPMTESQVAGEIDRYIGDPGQALGYMMGRLEIDRLRSSAEERLGETFDIRRFHDLVLSTGSVPLSTLRRTVEGWAG